MDKLLADAAVRAGAEVREGDVPRGRLFEVVHALKDELSRRGLTCMGSPSPIVPLLVGNEKLAHRLPALRRRPRGSSRHRQVHRRCAPT
jgi:7-keto-8-aminopelargonate synthetase-like enzyme